MNVLCTNLKKPSVFCLLLVIGCAGALDVIVAVSMSATYDEPQSVAYGERILHSRPDRSELGYDSKSPIAALNAIPRVIADRLDQGAIPSIRRKSSSFHSFRTLGQHSRNPDSQCFRLLLGQRALRHSRRHSGLHPSGLFSKPNGTWDIGNE